MTTMKMNSPSIPSSRHSLWARMTLIKGGESDASTEGGPDADDQDDVEEEEEEEEELEEEQADTDEDEPALHADVPFQERRKDTRSLARPLGRRGR